MNALQGAAGPGQGTPPDLPAALAAHFANLQAAFVLSIPRRAMSDETQETLRTSTFPSGPHALWMPARGLSAGCALHQWQHVLCVPACGLDAGHAVHHWQALPFPLAWLCAL